VVVAWAEATGDQSVSTKVTLAGRLRATHSSETAYGHGLSGSRRRLSSSAKTARTRWRPAGSTTTVAVTGRSATTEASMANARRTSSLIRTHC
jgi:hypothetical protein